MAIDEEIKTKGFANEWHKLRVNLLFTANWLENNIKTFLKPFGITQKQFNILRILRGHDGEVYLSILDIRDRMIDKMSDASRIVDRLAKKGLIAKHPCTMDKRTTRIQIKPAGLTLLAKIDTEVAKMDKFTRGISQKEAAQINKLLDKMRDKA